jgi:hypothetical protein
MHAKKIVLATLILGSFACSTKAAVPTGPHPSESKDMLGLDLKPQGAWKPTWDADAKVAKWENDEFMSSIVIRLVNDKLENVDDLKAAAPMMMQLGQAITKVADAPKTTDKGWYAVVEGDGTKDFIYVQKIGGLNVVCSANLKSDMGAGIKKDTALSACESIKLKS